MSCFAGTLDVPFEVSRPGQSSMKDMGTVMKAAMANLAGKSTDGSTVSEVVQASLS
ncbi:hypothetical protein BH10ACI3_BH10ACI3_28680 [soil metagenome]